MATCVVWMQRFTFLLTNDLVGLIISLAHYERSCWSAVLIIMVCSSNTDFQLYLYFCPFKIVTFSKTVKYLHKVFSVPKKFNLKFNGLSNIKNFEFPFGYLFSHRTAFKTHKMHSQTTWFQSKFPGGACPRIPLEARASGTRLIRLLVGSHPPAKNLSTWTGPNNCSSFRSLNLVFMLQ